MAAVFPQSKRSKKTRAGDTGTDRWRSRGNSTLGCSLLSPNNLGSDLPSFLLCVVGHVDQSWYSVGANYSRVWTPKTGILGAISRLATTVLNSGINSLVKYYSFPFSSPLISPQPEYNLVLPCVPLCLAHAMCSLFVEMKWMSITLSPCFFFLKKKTWDGRNLSETLLYLISLQIWKSRSRKSSLFVSSGAQARIWSLNGFPFSVFSTSLSLNFSLCNLELSLTQNLVALVINHLPLLLCLLCHRLHSTSIEIFSNAFIWFSFYVIISSFCSPSASLALTLNILNGQGFMDIKF